MVNDDIKEERRCVGKCLFCPLGDPDKRGVVLYTKVQFYGPFKLKQETLDERYECGLGEIGKDCIIPEIYVNSLRGEMGFIG